MSAFDQHSLTRIRKSVAEVYSYECQYCRNEFSLEELHLDHIHPLSSDGGDSLENITLACQTCNLKKSDGLVEEPGLSLLKTIAKKKAGKIRCILNKESNRPPPESSRPSQRTARWNLGEPTRPFFLDLSVTLNGETWTLDFKGEENEFSARSCRVHVPSPIDPKALLWLYQISQDFAGERKLGLYRERKGSADFSFQPFMGCGNCSLEEINRHLRAFRWLQMVRCDIRSTNNSAALTELLSPVTFLGVCNLKLEKNHCDTQTVKLYHPDKMGTDREQRKCIKIAENPEEVLNHLWAGFSKMVIHGKLGERLARKVADKFGHLISM